MHLAEAISDDLEVDEEEQLEGDSIHLDAAVSRLSKQVILSSKGMLLQANGGSAYGRKKFLGDFAKKNVRLG